MEAATSAGAPRKLDGDKAQRIIAAMRASVGTRGAAASTFDHVAREAGVSRGLLHYYFGSKERLLVEVVRHDGNARIANIDERLAKAQSADEIVDALVVGLEEFLAPLRGDPRRARRALPPVARAPRRLAAHEGARGRDPPPGRARGGRVDPVLPGRWLRHPGPVRPGLGPPGSVRARRGHRAPHARRGLVSPGAPGPRRAPAPVARPRAVLRRAVAPALQLGAVGARPLCRPRDVRDPHVLRRG